MADDALKSRLDRGEVAYGVVTAWPDPDLVEAAGACGFDFAFIDAEHGALDIRTCAELIRAAACGGMTPIVRVPYADVRGVYAYLDAGAQGLIFPHVRTAADAAAAVAACLFPPDGLRGAFSTSRAARYGTAYQGGEYLREANAAVWPIPLIEDLDAVDALDGILDVPGVRAFFIGPGDMTLSRLTPQGPRGDPVERVVDRAIATGVRKGKIVATVAGTPAAAAALVAKGVRVIAVGAPSLVTAAYRAYLEAAPRTPQIGGRDAAR
ncbi:MAG: aldolase/citrate lyase family protein [Armatimonadota bacterium]|nr:aldolase/citrate lyase family protein [Armatimonadota bacterium]